MVNQTQQALSEDLNTTKATKTTHTKIMRRAVAYSLVEDDVDNDVDVRDGGEV